MSTIKSQTEHLTLNADGSGKDIKFQSNGVEKASISSTGAFTSTTIDATKLSGDLPAISGASLTGIDALPSGGTTDQVLTKTASGEAWADAAAGGVTVKTLSTANDTYTFTATSETIMYSATSGGGGGGGSRGQDRTMNGGGGGSGCVQVPTSISVTIGTNYTVTLGAFGAKGNNYNGSANNDTDGGSGSATVLKETSSGTVLLSLGGGGGGIRAHGGGAGGSGGSVSGTQTSLAVAGSSGHSSTNHSYSSGGSNAIGSGWSKGGDCPYSNNSNYVSSTPGSGILFATIVH